MRIGSRGWGRPASSIPSRVTWALSSCKPRPGVRFSLIFVIIQSLSDCRSLQDRDFFRMFHQRRGFQVRGDAGQRDTRYQRGKLRQMYGFARHSR